MDFPNIRSVDDFKNLVARVEAHPNYRRPIASGFFVGWVGEVSGRIIAGRYPVPNWNDNYGSAAVFMAATGLLDRSDWQGASEVQVDINTDMLWRMLELFHPFLHEAVGPKHRNVQMVQRLRGAWLQHLARTKLVFLFADTKVESIPAAYLKLSALSHRKVQPNGLVVDGIFGALPELMWDMAKGTPVEPEALDKLNPGFDLDGAILPAYSWDKFPLYTMMMKHEPSIRILDPTKVRFGAYLSPGTVVMPGASYINFNAGILLPRFDLKPGEKRGAMIEGRVSSSATVGNGTDVGGGASIAGVLSGGNSVPISVGERCLLSANSSLAVPIGDDNRLSANVAFMPNTDVVIGPGDLELLVAANKRPLRASMKAKELAGMSQMLILPGPDGGVKVRLNTKSVTLNDALHGKDV